MKHRHTLKARAGGTAGPRTRDAEATIWGVSNLDARNMIINSVRERPLFARLELKVMISALKFWKNRK